MSKGPTIAALALLLLACRDQPGAAPTTERNVSAENLCDAPRITGRVASALNEASGVTIGRERPDVLWVVNDDGPPVLFGVDSTGSVRFRVSVRNARNTDWESLASAPCGAGFCLYIADIGDNLRRRDVVRIYRVPEPRADEQSVTAEAFDFRYPDGPHDAEALFIMPGEQAYVITKGRSEAITVYRYPGTLRANSTVTLEAVQQLSTSFVQLPDMITGAGSTPDGRWIALRTYSAFALYQLRDGQLMPQSPRISLEPLHEFQGEGIDIAPDGTIALVSEKGLDEGLAPISRLECRLTSSQ